MDNEALEALYRRHYSAALAYCTALCGEEHTAQDLVSAAFVKAILTLPEEISSFRYWLLRVCKNLWIDELRRQQHLGSDEPLQYMSDHITPESICIQEERSRCLWAALASLPPPDRELVTLHYFSGLPLYEIALMMGKSYPAVRQRLSRLRHTLKLRMEEQGYGL